RLTSGRDRKLSKALHALGGLAVHVVGRIEALDLGCNLHRQPLGIEGSDAACTALARQQARPVFVDAIADWSDRPQTGDDDTVSVHRLRAHSSKYHRGVVPT